MQDVKRNSQSISSLRVKLRTAFVAYYASAETLKLQKEMRKLHVLIRDIGPSRFYLEENILKAKIKQSMDEARAIATE